MHIDNEYNQDLYRECYYHFQKWDSGEFHCLHPDCQAVSIIVSCEGNKEKCELSKEDIEK